MGWIHAGQSIMAHSSLAFSWPSNSNMVVSIVMEVPPKWLVYQGKSHENG